MTKNSSCTCSPFDSNWKLKTLTLYPGSVHTPVPPTLLLLGSGLLALVGIKRKRNK